ncbi:MAG: hypothetical protein AB7S26_39755 [Sandaracinaceae bacterium]
MTRSEISRFAQPILIAVVTAVLTAIAMRWLSPVAESSASADRGGRDKSIGSAVAAWETRRSRPPRALDGDGGVATAPPAVAVAPPHAVADEDLMASMLAEAPSSWGRDARFALQRTAARHLDGTGATLSSVDCRTRSCVIDVEYDASRPVELASASAWRWLSALSVEACEHGTLGVDRSTASPSERLFLRCLGGRPPNADFADSIPPRTRHASND